MRPVDAALERDHVDRLFVVTRPLMLEGGIGWRVVTADAKVNREDDFVGVMSPGELLYASAVYAVPQRNGADAVFVRYRIVTDSWDPLDGLPLVARHPIDGIRRLDDAWVRELTPEERTHFELPPLVRWDLPPSWSDRRWSDRVDIHHQIRLLRFFMDDQTYRPAHLPAGVAEPEAAPPDTLPAAGRAVP